MRTLSQTLQNTLDSGAPRYFKRAELYPRLWSGTAFYYGGAVDISGCLLDITPVKWKLDSESYGVWNYSNCTLTLRNERGQFREANSAGHFGLSGAMKNSKIRVWAGSLRADGTEETACVFTGYISAGPVYNPDERTVSFTLYDHMYAFEETNAEALSVPEENQLLGSDSGTDFQTASERVGLVSEVRRGPASGGAENAAVLNPCTDYAVTGLNQSTGKATVSLAEPLTSGEAVWASWLCWHQNKQIHWLVEQLCALAGVSDTAISPVAFSNDVENGAVYDTQGQWQAGTSALTDAASYPGAVAVSEIALADKTFAAAGGGSLASNWTLYNHGSRYDVFYGQHLTGEPAVCAASSAATGTWDFEIYGHYNVCPFFYFLASAGNYSAAQGYALGRARDDGKWKLWRMNGEGGSIIWNSGFGTVSGTGAVRARIARTAAGEFFIALYNPDTGALLSGSMNSAACIDTAYATASHLITRYSLTDSGGLARYGYIKNIRYTANPATGGGKYELGGTWTSPEIDGTAALEGWGLLAASQAVPPGCAAAFHTRQRAAQTDQWEEWTPVFSTGQIQASKRYLQVRWTAGTGAAQEATPLLYSLRAPFRTTNTTITLANMGGLTVKDALDQLSQLSCYEMGFDAQDRFVFRPRATAISSARRLDRSNIEKLTTLTDGSERVYNRVVVSFGDYRAVADSASSGDAAPTSEQKHGVRELSISSAALLPAENVNLAQALAPTVYGYTSRARRRATVDAKFDLRLELGDRVSVDYPQEDLFSLWRWGAPTARFGGESLRYYSQQTMPGALLLAGVDMRVEGIELDLQSWRARYDLVEVL